MINNVVATNTYGFLGLGLIGGSIAKAIRKMEPSCKIIAYDTNPDTLALADSEETITQTCYEIGEAFSDCNIIFLCAPVSSNDDNLLKLKQYLSKDCLLTDVGSVKQDIHEHISQLQLDSQFIGGHPMTGSERTGYANSKERLLENAYYILTPTPYVPQDKVAYFKNFVEQLGAIPLILDSSEHDYVTAAVSHLPHVIAASLVNLIQESDQENGIMKLIAAGGFKDITRIASSSPTMWQHICMTNTDNIIKLLDLYMNDLTTIRDSLNQKNSSALYQFFGSARSYRDSFADASSGPIKKSFTLYVDIPDETGALASIATMLAFHQINIKNIGITHNREFEEGILSIEFYEENAVDQAADILSARNYLVHKKH